MVSSLHCGCFSSLAVFLSCMNSPSTRFAITVASSSTTSGSRNLARATEARPKRKSPASTAILLPNSMLAEGADRLVVDVSITSSCRREAVWISSTISASRRCEGRIVGSVSVVDVGFRLLKSVEAGWSGLLSKSTEGEEIGVSIDTSVGVELGVCRCDLGAKAVACDMSRTNKGRTCLPSDCV